MMKLALLLFVVSCTNSTLNVTTKTIRTPAQAQGYIACHTIEEELLIDQVNLATLPRNFETVKNQVFKNNCASCHFGPDAYKPHLDDYAETLEYIDLNTPSNSRLLQTISQGKMPPSYNMQYREPDAYRFLRQWVQDGAPRD